MSQLSSRVWKTPWTLQMVILLNGVSGSKSFLRTRRSAHTILCRFVVCLVMVQKSGVKNPLVNHRIAVAGMTSTFSIGNTSSFRVHFPASYVCLPECLMCLHRISSHFLRRLSKTSAVVEVPYGSVENGCYTARWLENIWSPSIVCTKLIRPCERNDWFAQPVVQVGFCDRSVFQWFFFLNHQQAEMIIHMS